VAAETVARPRLFARLREGRGRRLTLLAGPAGFGKSTLLAAWRAQEEAAGRPVAWVSVDEGDDDPVVLWAHVIAALGLDREGLAATAPLLESVLPRLVNALAAAEGERVLVLDDFHRLSRPAARATVAWFAEHLPATVQLVVASRTDPALPLAALRARGQLLELRADALRFTPEEAEAFLNERLRLALEPADVALLTARTEGWPAGLYLAALSLDGASGGERHVRVEAFGGTSATHVDYGNAARPPLLSSRAARTT
jgi:LuxR family transcriptional regulator, maltose regulon positive regulatory protein